MPLILHISDWHCQGNLPNNFENFAADRKPDLLVITGDMLEDGLDPWNREPLVQSQQLQYWQELHSNLRELFPLIPIVGVPGNHERINYMQEWTRKDPNFHSFDLPEPRLLDLAGIKISGFRGTPEHGLRWHYEIHDLAQIWILQEIPKETQLLLTHAPPFGILDEFPGHDNKRAMSANRTSYGIRMKKGSFKEIKDLHVWLPNLEAHCFGHIHEQKGIEIRNGITYSNASCGWNWITL